MANALTHSLPFCVKNARFTLPLGFRTSAGTPTDPTTPDTEYSSDGGATFSDCAEEITTGGANGWGYLTLTGAETNNNVVLIAAKSANCVTTPAVLYPRVLPVLLSGTASAGGSTSITLAAGAYDLTGCIVRTTGGTGGGGTGGANNQARVITAYNTSTLVATVSPAWETNPDSTTTYDILLTDLAVNSPITRGLRPTTDGRTAVVDAAGLIDANVVKLGPTGSGTAQTARDIGASVLLSTGTGTGQLDFTSGVVKANITQCGGSTVPAGAIPNAVAGAASGLLIAGSNAATTFATLTVSGAVAFQSTFAVTTSTSLGALSATTVTFSGAVAFQSTFAVTGTTTLAALTTSGTVTFNAFTVTNSFTNNGTVDVAQTGNNYTRLGTPAGASIAADIAAAKADTAAIKTKTDSLTFTVAAQVDANVIDWKSATAPAMTGDAFARLGAPLGASVSADMLVALKLLKADAIVDTSTTPWALVMIEAGTGGIGTGTELLRKPLYDTSGGNIGNTTTVIGRAKQ